MKTQIKTGTKLTIETYFPVQPNIKHMVGFTIVELLENVIALEMENANGQPLLWHTLDFIYDNIQKGKIIIND